MEFTRLNTAAVQMLCSRIYRRIAALSGSNRAAFEPSFDDLEAVPRKASNDLFYSHPPKLYDEGIFFHIPLYIASSPPQRNKQALKQYYDNPFDLHAFAAVSGNA